VARSRGDFQSSLQQNQPFPHAKKSDTSVRPRTKLPAGVESQPVILDGQAEHVFVVRKGSPDPLSLCMFADICESFLQEPIEVDADAIRYSWQVRARILDR
jgi:hypothetical protein